MAERPVLCTFSKNNSTARSTKVKRFGMTEVNFLMRCPLSPRTDCFFFQAEDGIRDGRVTGVQTCALPIWLLAAALAEGPAHAYLLHGPPGVGKRALALLFAAELLGDHARVERRTHPDLYVLEPVGDQIGRASCRERVWVAVGGGAGREKEG